MKLLIIHLSDLHVNKTIDFFEEKVSGIVEAVKNYSQIVHVLFLFTGDITFSGQTQQFEIARRFIENIRKKLDEPSGKDTRFRSWFSICPGNHDRNLDKSITLYDLESTNIDNFNEKLQSKLRFNSNYLGFQNIVSKPEKINDLLYRFSFDMDGKKVCIYSLNNTLLSAYYSKEDEESSDIKRSAYDDNKGRVFIPKEYLNISRGNEDLSILLMHIPFAFLCDETQKFLRTICEKGIDFVFSGHVHESLVSTINREGDNMIEFVSPALSANGMSSFCCLEIDGNEVYKTTYVFSQMSRNYICDKKQEDAFVFKRKEATVFCQNVQSAFSESISQINLDARYSFDWEKIFVFPLLSVSNYSKNRLSISDFKSFEEKRKRNNVICISAEELGGKTTLARALFHYYIREGYAPLLIDGSSLKSSASFTIKTALKEIYSNKGILETFEKTPKDKKILIIDDFEKATDKLILECLEHVGSIVYFRNSSESLLRVFDESGVVQVLTLRIEPFFYNKRTVLLENIYSSMSSKDSGIQENFTKESLITSFEQLLVKMDSINSMDPKTIALLAVQILTKVDIYRADSARALFHFGIKTRIEEGLREGKYQKCDLKIAERLISDVAFQLYKRKSNVFIEVDFVEALKREEDVMGGTPINSVSTFLFMLVNHQIIKKKEDGFMFFDRSTFAYFIGKYAVEKYHTNQDRSCLEAIVQNGIYSPLNFQILLSISTVYDYGSILSFLVNDLYPKVSCADALSENSLKCLSDAFSQKKNALMAISKEEQAKLSSKKGKAENKARQEYLKNIDNYFYEEKNDKKLREIIEWCNRMQIASVLLNCCATSLVKDDKAKLVEMTIKLPNIALRALVEETIVALNDFFAEAKEILEKEKDGVKTFEEIKEYILGALNAVILVYYDMSSRPLNNPIVVDQIGEELKKKGTISDVIQRLMVLSFSRKYNVFVEEATKAIKSNNEYLSNCARLIGRRFCFDNLDLVSKDYKGFVNLITHGKGIQLLKEKVNRKGWKNSKDKK